MKTKIRTLVILSVLGLIGLNSTAATNRFEVSNITEIALLNENEETSATIDFRKEAQQISKWVADQQEARLMQKLAVDGISVASESTVKSNNESGVDYRAEAQAITKLIADQVETKATLKILN